MLTAVALALLAAEPIGVPVPSTPADPFAWLEDISGEKALAWVRARNAETLSDVAAAPEFEPRRKAILEVLDSPDRIPDVQRLGAHYYNFWRDAAHPRGLWRRTSLAEYRRPKPAWDTVLDLDALAAQEHENWIWHGADCLPPDYRRCLVGLSRGGADAQVVREFDLAQKAFVAGGFTLPEAKSQTGWIDADTVFVATDFGPGSMTSSGYPRIVKRWTRGTPLSAASVVFEGQPSDVQVYAFHDHTPGFARELVGRQLDFFNAERFLRQPSGALVPFEVPTDASLSFKREWLLIELRTPWTVGAKTFPGGSLLAAPFDAFLAGQRAFVALFTPTATRSLSGYSWTHHHLILNELDDVSSRNELLTPAAHGDWRRQPLGHAPALSSVSAFGTDSDLDDEIFVTSEGFLTPTTLSRQVADGPPEILKHNPVFFDAAALEVSQAFARSLDGTRVPYFVIAPKGLALDGSHPTILYGYGGFEVSLTPAYAGAVGRGWLAQGGVYAIANIRGGGEYGSAWHLAALKQHRLRAYEDFAAVAQDLVARKITSPRHLGAMGGSNGGLLVGNMLTLYPALFGAIACAVPLLDMQRYSHLSAGASWIGEYGDPDLPQEWAFIQKFSPYFNARPGVTYPPVLFTTSTKDDRVGPVQARKMAAKLLSFGDPVRFYENLEGGHGAAANNQEAAFMRALAYTFLSQKLR